MAQASIFMCKWCIRLISTTVHQIPRAYGLEHVHDPLGSAQVLRLHRHVGLRGIFTSNDLVDEVF